MNASIHQTQLDKFEMIQNGTGVVSSRSTVMNYYHDH